MYKNGIFNINPQKYEIWPKKFVYQSRVRVYGIQGDELFMTPY